MMKRLELILFGFVAICGIQNTIAQTYTDGPMNLQVRVAYVYVDDYHDVFGGNHEPVWFVWTRDDANHDGQGWRNSAGCINRSCACYLWQGQPGGLTGPTEILMNHNYGTNVPQRLDFEMENWEDDGIGGSCSYNGPCSICVDPDDAKCGRGTLANNIYYRNAGPPCSWVGATDALGGYDYYMCSNSWGVGIQFWWQYNASTTGTHTWRGHNSTNWFEACNWSTSAVPTSARNVVIPASGYTYAPTIPSGTAYCNTIEIQGNTVLTINTSAGAVLQVTQ
jgi:hypothetical protein